MLFFEWYRKTHKLAKKLSTFESGWKHLRQLYYDHTTTVVKKDVGDIVTDVSKFQSLGPKAFL